MLLYYTVVKESSPYYLYNEDGSILFQINRKYRFFKDLFTIKDYQGKDILIFEVKNILSSKINIVFQNFEEKIILTKKNNLIVEDRVIYFLEDINIFQKYKSLIMVNEEIIGKVHEEYIFPYKKYLISFYHSGTINYYSLVLFAITSVYFADGI